ncbi:MAG TPA: SpoIIE family protein phosphatase [Terracidiphilus sp.]
MLVFRGFLVKACLVAAVLQFACAVGSEPARGRVSANLVVDVVGEGAIELDGGWRFHTGDNSDWCRPELSDTAWDVIQPDQSWGSQGYPSYTGYAWYRKHITIEPSQNQHRQYRLLIPAADDAYELYWNCKLIGSYGKLPPRPSWYYSTFPRSFALSGERAGVLSIRFWKAPLETFSTDELGGLYATPLLGAPEVIQLNQDSVTWQVVRAQLFDYSLVLLRVFIATLCLLLWRRIREQLFVWLALFTVTPIALEMLEHLFLIPFPYPLARFINQPVYMLYSVSLWFLLLHLLELNENAGLRRLTKRLAWIGLGLASADAVLASQWAHAGPAMQWADGILVGSMLLLEMYPLVLVGLGLRRKHHISRWAVALAAFALKMFESVASISAVGQRFTHWSLYDKVMDAPILSIQGVEFTIDKVGSLALFAIILFAVFRYLLEQQARRTTLEQEMQSAREIQRVLMPETLPAIDGFAISSAYIPAQEVGGDFFQILPHPDGSSIIAIGDVSGKGLKAAMSVSMIVGALRAQSATTSGPAAILDGVNRCLLGRMNGGFATAILLRLDPDGTITLANAGHLPPFLNGQEHPIDPSLPLGMVPDIFYSESTLRIHPGDELLFYTDGLVEAQDENKQMYGFDRLRVLMALKPAARAAAQRAVDYGQQDDITVLTLTRLAAGETASMSVTAPVFEDASIK